MELQSYRYGDFHLNYAQWGTGPHALLAFHGYGRSHRDFEEFVKPWQNIFTIYAFDLPYHEDSIVEDRRADKKPWKPKELRGIFAGFLSEISADKAWLMGYSLGGRVALKLAELMPEKIGGLYLFAPDGLKTNRWYAFLSKYAIGRATFRLLRRHHRFFFKVMDLALRLNLTEKKMHRFITSQVATDAMRQQVYDVWTFYRHIEIEPDKFIEVTRNEGIPVDLFFGKYDKVIPASNSRKLAHRMPEARIHILEAGHAMLNRELARRIADHHLLSLPEENPPTDSQIIPGP